MVKKADIESLVAQYRSQLAAEKDSVAAGQARVADLEAKIDRLLITSETLGELEVAFPEVEAKRRRGGPGRPPGIVSTGYKSRRDLPTIPAMIFAALKDAKKRGLVGLRPMEIKDYIDAHWPGKIRGKAAGAVCWKLWNEGRLVKLREDRDIYSLPPDETEAGDAASTVRH
jgi:hypothetical protein